MKWKQLDALTPEQRAYLLEYSAQWPFKRVFGKMLAGRLISFMLIAALAVGVALMGIRVGVLFIVFWGFSKLLAAVRLALLAMKAKGRDDIMIYEAYRTMKRLEKVNAPRAGVGA